jgi:hypothetical protein
MPFFIKTDRCGFDLHNQQDLEPFIRLPLFRNTSGIFTGLSPSSQGLKVLTSPGKALIGLKLYSLGAMSLTVPQGFSFIIAVPSGLQAVTGINFPSAFVAVASVKAIGPVITYLRDLRYRIGDYWLLSQSGKVWRLTASSAGSFGATSTP